MLSPQDVQNIQALVDGNGSLEDRKSFARIILTLFNQDVPQSSPPDHGGEEEKEMSDLMKEILEIERKNRINH